MKKPIAKSYFLNYGKPWSKKENQFLRKHYRKMTATKIGDRLGRTRSSVMGQANVLGIAKPKRTKWQIEADAMFENGYTDAEIAKAIKVDLRDIERWRKENDLYSDQFRILNDYGVFPYVKGRVSQRGEKPTVSWETKSNQRGTQRG